MKEKDTKFIVVPKGSSFTYSSLGDFLNTFYRTDGEEAHFKLATVPIDGFYIPHEIITKIKNDNPEWKKHFEFYSKKGDGKEMPYSIPTRKKCADEKKNLSQLAETLERKSK